MTKSRIMHVQHNKDIDAINDISKSFVYIALFFFSATLMSCNEGFQPFDNGMVSTLSGVTVIHPATQISSPPATEITDSANNKWTVSSGEIFANGKAAGYSANVTLLLYDNGVIYQQNSSGNWWSWTNGAWAAATDPRVFTDAQGNTWTVSSGVVYENGKPAGYSTNVTLLEYNNDVVYQQNAGGNWWSWVNGDWVSTGNPGTSTATPTPKPTATPMPTPTVTPSPTASPISGTSAFSCSSFSKTGACGAVNSYPGGQPFYFMGGGGANVSGNSVELLNVNSSNHVASSMMYQKPVNVQSFSASFTFVPNEWNLTFVLENTNNVPGYGGNVFVAGAGCEAGFYQAFTGAPPNNIFAMEFDMRSSLRNENPYNILPPDSTVQIYQQDESPCNPNDSQPNYVYKPKISTAPVSFLKPLVSKTNAALDYNPTGDTYSATINYDGSNLTLNLYDVTTKGSCPGSGCFTQTWTAVNIPSMVSGNTAYVGLTTGTSQPTSGSSIVTDVGPTNYSLYIDSFNYASEK